MAEDCPQARTNLSGVESVGQLFGIEVRKAFELGDAAEESEELFRIYVLLDQEPVVVVLYLCRQMARHERFQVVEAHLEHVLLVFGLTPRDCVEFVFFDV